MAIRRWTIAVAAAVMLYGAATAAGQQPPPTPLPPSLTPGLPSLTPPEHAFVMKVAEDNVLELQLGTLAAQKAQREDVKAFGQRMVADHRKIGEDLKQLAITTGVMLPKGPPSPTAVDTYATLSGPDFDRQYVADVTRDHQRDVDAFRRMSREAKDPVLKAWVINTLPMLERHLAQIKEIQDKLAARGN